MKLIYLSAMSLALAGCNGGVVFKDRFVEVKVPVSAPCVRGERPTEVQPLNTKMTKEDWDVLGTDQREKLLLAQAADRKVYGDELFVATVGCP